MLWILIGIGIVIFISALTVFRKTDACVPVLVMGGAFIAISVFDYLRPPFEDYRIADIITKTEKLSEKTTKITEIQIIEKRMRNKISGSWDMTSLPKYEEKIKERIEFSEGKNK